MSPDVKLVKLRPNAPPNAGMTPATKGFVSPELPYSCSGLAKPDAIVTSPSPAGFQYADERSFAVAVKAPAIESARAPTPSERNAAPRVATRVTDSFSPG